MCLEEMGLIFKIALPKTFFDCYMRLNTEEYPAYHFTLKSILYKSLGFLFSVC